MRFGIQIGHVDITRLHDVCQTAEGQGFDAIYFPDHLVAEGPERQRMGAPSWDCMIMAAIAAQATQRARVGHLVLCNLFRHPAVTAQSLATIDHLSGGRAIAGLGSGWTETEFKMTGIPFPPIGPRLRMLDEALTCIKGLWSGEPFTHEGEFYRFREAELLPKAAQKPHPPILLGGGGKGLLRIAAKHADVLNIISAVGEQGYISMAGVKKLSDDAFRSKVEFVRAEAARLGRDPKSIEISNVTFTVFLADSAAASQAMREGTAGMLGGSPDTVARAPMALIGTPDEVIAEIRRRAREWEVKEIVIPLQDEALAARFAREVIPALRDA
jgi:probable F420-dependent oxidoreductase